MPHTPPYQLLDSLLHLLLAFQLGYAVWEHIEAPLMRKAVTRRLEGSKTLEELIIALQEVLQQGK